MEFNPMKDMLDNMKYVDDEDDNTDSYENILVRMHDELILNEIDDQMEERLNKSQTNFLGLYLDNYSMCKKQLDGDTEYIGQLKEIRNNVLEQIISKIETIFMFEVEWEDEYKIKQIAKTLYNFFILDYTDNVVTFLTNYILKYKKVIHTELKSMKKKSRDISYTATKATMNQIDAAITNNINTVIFKIIPAIEEAADEYDFIQFITSEDSNMTNTMMDTLISECRLVSTDVRLFTNFMEPLFNKEIGYPNIINKVILNLVKHFTIISDDEYDII